MLFRLSAAHFLIGLTTITFLAGCLPMQAKMPNDPPVSRPPTPSRVQPDTMPTAELRIPGEAVAQAAEIPVVPVPPIPGGPGATQRTTAPPVMPDIRPVSTQQPLSQRPSNPTESPVAVTPMPTVPSAVRPSAPEPADIKQVIQQANDAYGQLDSYIARLTRREQINGKNKPEEVMSFMFRKQPWSLHFKWLGTEGHDREVVYVKGQYEGKIHTILAAGDSLLMPAGKRMSLAPDSILVKSASRYPITEAGIGASIDRITALNAALEHGDKSQGTLIDLGVQKRPDYAGTLHLIEHRFPPDSEPVMPRGGRRLYGFDTVSRLPVLLVCVDEKGAEVEYYRYERIMAVKLDDADFNPDNMGAGTKTTQKP